MGLLGICKILLLREFTKLQMYSCSGPPTGTALSRLSFLPIKSPLSAPLSALSGWSSQVLSRLQSDQDLAQCPLCCVEKRSNPNLGEVHVRSACRRACVRGSCCGAVGQEAERHKNQRFTCRTALMLARGTRGTIGAVCAAC